LSSLIVRLTRFSTVSVRTFPVVAVSVRNELARHVTSRHVCTVTASFLQSFEESPFQPFFSRLSGAHVNWLVSLSESVVAFVTYTTCSDILSNMHLAFIRAFAYCIIAIPIDIQGF